jgi:hypothetical protein
MRTLIVSAVFSILGLVAASQAQDIGDVQQGRQLALDVCAACHAVRVGQTQSPLASPFGAPQYPQVGNFGSRGSRSLCRGAPDRSRFGVIAVRGAPRALRLRRPGSSVIKHMTSGCVLNVTFNCCALLR